MTSPDDTPSEAKPVSANVRMTPRTKAAYGESLAKTIDAVIPGRRVLVLTRADLEPFYDGTLPNKLDEEGTDIPPKLSEAFWSLLGSLGYTPDNYFAHSPSQYPEDARESERCVLDMLLRQRSAAYGFWQSGVKHTMTLEDQPYTLRHLFKELASDNSEAAPHFPGLDLDARDPGFVASHEAAHLLHQEPWVTQSQSMESERKADTTALEIFPQLAPLIRSARDMSALHVGGDDTHFLNMADHLRHQDPTAYSKAMTFFRFDRSEQQMREDWENWQRFSFNPQEQAEVAYSDLARHLTVYRLHQGLTPDTEFAKAMHSVLDKHLGYEERGLQDEHSLRRQKLYRTALTALEKGEVAKVRQALIDPFEADRVVSMTAGGNLPSVDDLLNQIAKSADNFNSTIYYDVVRKLQDEALARADSSKIAPDLHAMMTEWKRNGQIGSLNSGAIDPETFEAGRLYLEAAATAYPQTLGRYRLSPAAPTPDNADTLIDMTKLSPLSSASAGASAVHVTVSEPHSASASGFRPDYKTG